MKDLHTGKELKIAEPYKDPVFLFTSSSLRLAAWAGWYSAFGDKERTESLVHQAYAEWGKEIGTGRNYSFVKSHNDDLYHNIPEEKLKELANNFLKQLKKELKKAKARQTPETKQAATKN